MCINGTTVFAFIITLRSCAILSERPQTKQQILLNQVPSLVLSILNEAFVQVLLKQRFQELLRNNFMKNKEVLLRLNGKFWNEMLMFYLSVA